MECAGVCVDFQTNDDHCGRCEMGCSPLQECAGGQCGCGDLAACPGGATGFCSRRFERHCCDPGALFCDVNDAIGYGGGCLPSSLDCGSLFACGGDFAACPVGQTAYCSSTEVPQCCGTDRPVFCDSVPAINYDGGCWVAGVECGTLTLCGPVIFACIGNDVPYCSSTDEITCCPAGDRFCDAIPGIGYGGSCWPPDVDCGTITNCGGQFVACPTGSGSPNCMGQCV
jgi:hypothetical protein